MRPELAPDERALLLMVRERMVIAADHAKTRIGRGRSLPEDKDLIRIAKKFHPARYLTAEVEQELMESLVRAVRKRPSAKKIAYYRRRYFGTDA